MKRWLRALEVLAWFAFFAFAGVVLALRYWVLPDIERYRGDIVAAISRAVGLPVQVGAIEAGWTGLRPTIALSDVRIHDAQGREALVLPSVTNVVSWRSLLHRDLRLHSLVIDRPRLGVRRDAAGALYVAGIRLGQGGRGEGGFADWVLAQDEIVIRRAELEWRDEQRGAPPLALSSLELRIRNTGAEHAVGLSARPTAEPGSTLEVRARLVGESAMRPSAWNGRLYAELGRTDLAAWRAWIDYPLDLREGHGALRLWATLRDGKVTEATADVALFQVIALLEGAPAALRLDSVSGRLQGRARGEGYELAGRGLAFTLTQGASIAPTDFQIAWHAGGGSLGARLLELGTLPELAPAFPLPDALRARIAQAAPRGRLEDAAFEWQGELARPAGYAARGRFSGLALNATEGVPGFAGLSGSLEATQAGGRLVLRSRGAALELPEVFPEPRVALDTLEGQVDWEHHGSALNLRIVSLAFANADLAGGASGSFSRAGPNSARVDLNATLARADGTQLARYLPRPGLMGSRTRAWLAESITRGRASDVRLRLRGNLRDFPFADPASGEFRVSARVHDAVLEYAKGWPRIERIDAELLFERDAMQITGRSAGIFGARLANVRVSIPKLSEGAHVLISGEAQGATTEFLRFIAASPVAKRTGGFTEGLRASGRGRLRLGLDLPLAALDASRVQGEYAFEDNDIVVHEDLPKLARAAGKVSFTESGFSVHDVRAATLGGTVAVRGGTRPEGATEIVARGDATLAEARAYVDHPWTRFLSGASTYVATFSVREGATRVRIESPLRGVAIALPPPFAKGAGEALPLRVELAPSRSGVRERVSIALGKLAAAELQLRKAEGGKTEVRRASLWLSPEAGQPIRLPERPGTLVYGAVAALDADAWMRTLKADPAVAGGAPSQAGIDLRIGVLDAYGKRVNNLQLRAGTEAEGWTANVKADEISGDLQYRSAGGGRLVARLEHFKLPAESPGAGAQAAHRSEDAPAIDIVAERVDFRGKQLGRVEIVAEPAGQDWRIEKLRMVNPEATLAAKGNWQTGTPSRSALDFALEMPDAGGFLGRVGHAGLVKGGRARLSGSLTWQGTPFALDYPSLSGAVELRAEDGQFLEIEPGIGKLISLMSLQALPRRIALDFRDVFSKGFRFEAIEAAARLDRGVMTVKEFRMRGPAAEVQMSGLTDLARETQDLKVRVFPSLGGTASTAVAIVNPLAGAAALLAQKVLKDPLGQIFAYDYAVTGTWSDPHVEKIVLPSSDIRPSP